MTDKKVVSIQVITTILTGGGVERVPFKEADRMCANSWSFYKRFEDGTVQWIRDVRISVAETANGLYGSVLTIAAKLSMEHQAYIEQIE